MCIRDRRECERVRERQTERQTDRDRVRERVRERRRERERERERERARSSSLRQLSECPRLAHFTRWGNSPVFFPASIDPWVKPTTEIT